MTHVKEIRRKEKYVTQQQTATTEFMDPVFEQVHKLQTNYKNQLINA